MIRTEPRIVHAPLAAIALAGAMLCAATHAEEVPLWEAGAGIAVLNFPDYRGSDERHTLVLPFPYLVYNGEFFKSDRESVRGQFYKDDRFDLHLSANGSIPVDSEDNSARRGMPNLDPTLEIGPNLTVTLLRSETMHLNLRFPLRVVIATDLRHARDEGWVFQPQVNVDFYDIFPGPGWNSVREPALSQLLLWRRSRVRDPGKTGLRGTRRLFRHAVRRRAQQALCFMVGWRLREGRYAIRSGFREQSAGAAEGRHRCRPRRGLDFWQLAETR
jgi:hypothetical protein